MKPLEIVCESCESHMRLSVSLLQKISGKSGRVTCWECGSKIMVDATGETVRITKGGRQANSSELKEIEDFTEAQSSADPHLSEMPIERLSVAPAHGRPAPPPVPREARARSRQAQAQMSRGVSAAVQFSRDSDVFEAPAPIFGSDGSLSPLALDDKDDDGLVPLGREFNSSPFASERDESYNSLFPQPERRPAPVIMDAPVPTISKAPSPPKRGELRRMKSEPEIFKDEISVAPAVAATVVEMGPDGQLINQADKKEQKAHSTRSNHWVPWTVAAIALLGLGVSVSLGRRATPAVIEAPDAALPTAATTAALDDRTASEEPTTAALEQTPEFIETEASPSETVVAPESSQAMAPAPKKDQLEAAPSSLKPSTQAEAPVVEKPEESTVEEADTEEPADEPVLAPFSSTSAATAMREATALAGACRKTGDPTGYAKVVVTFAPSGRVTRAAVTGAPFAGTETGGCIASRFRTARVPAFAGEYVTVSKTVTIQ